MPKKKTKNKKKVKKASSGKFSFQKLVFAIVALAVILIFMPTSILLGVGMLPTLVSYIVDRSLEKNKTFTVGAMNFSGCFPYLLMLWTGENSTQGAWNFVGTPEVIIVIYTIAGMGYVINWGVTQVVSNILIQRSQARISKIDKEKKQLEERWGAKVNGKYDLDENGFPIVKSEE